MNSALLVLSLLVSDAPTARELEAKSQAYREAIKSGHVVLVVTSPTHKNNRAYEQITSIYDITFKGSSVLSKVTSNHPNWMTQEAISIHDGDVILDRVDKKQRVWITGEKPGHPGQHAAIPIQVLGMYPSSVDQLHAADIGSVFEWLSNRQSQVSLTEYEGMKSWLIDYAPFNRQIVRVWILPDRGFSVVKIECTSSSANGQHHAQTTTVSTYKQFQTIWFPEVVEFSYTLNGELHNHERITVREAVFNLPISVDAFNISAMNLAKGRPVLAPGNVGMEWDGSKLVSQVAEQPRINVAAETTTSTWLLVCYAAIATSVAALIFVRYARARAT